MNPSVRAASVKLAASERKTMAVWALAGAEPVSALAAPHGVSHPLVYRQRKEASDALDNLFSAAPTADDADKAHCQLVALAERYRQASS